MTATPSLADFRARFVAFADTAADTVEAYLSDATAEISHHIPSAEQPKAIMLLAAHALSLNGAQGGEAGQFATARAAGVTEIKDGTTGVKFAAQSAGSGLSGSIYGQQYLDIAERYAPIGYVASASLIETEEVVGGFPSTLPIT